MTVLVIRAHKRFGVCRSVTLRGADGAACAGLLIELSLEGCRVSNLGAVTLTLDQQVDVDIAGCGVLGARVRWQKGQIVGLRLVRPLHHAELARLIHACRAAPCEADALRA